MGVIFCPNLGTFGRKIKDHQPWCAHGKHRQSKIALRVPLVKVACRNGDALGVTELNLFWSFVVSSIAVGAIVGALLTR